MNEKYLLSILEASKMFGIGQHRLRQIVAEDYECKYHLKLGRTIKIKKKSFEDFLEVVQEL